MEFEEMLSEESINELVDDFLEDLKESFKKSYENFKIESQQHLEDLSLELKSILEGFPFFDNKSERETVECQQLILTLNLIAIKTKSTIYVTTNKKENCISCIIKSNLLTIKGELLPLLSFAIKHCESINLFNNSLHFSYRFEEKQ